MTDLLYLDDSYLSEFRAIVKEVHNGGIILDKTAFYVGGGGQPCDTGIIEFDGIKSEVIEVRRDNFVHVIEGQLPKVGEEIIGKIDWNRRYKIMRTHTALHVLSGVAYQNFGVKITGNQLYPARARVDLSFENLSKELVKEIIDSTNEVIKRDLKVRAYYITPEEFKSRPELMRVNPKLYEKYEKIRIVEIENFDAQADGGTHVKSTSEIGRVVLQKYESKGRKNKRIYIGVEND